MSINKKLNDQQKIDIVSAYQTSMRSVELGKKYGVTPQAILQLLKRRGIQIKGYKDATSWHTLDYSYFEIIDSEEKAYFLGLIFADGNTSIHKTTHKFAINLTQTDDYLLYRLRDCLKSDCDIRTYYKGTGYGEKNGKPFTTLSIYHKAFVLSLIDKGCVPAKSKIVELPKEVPNYLMNHFIRGYLDGDGCITMPKDIKNLSDLNKTGVSITSSTLFCNQLKTYLLQHNISFSIIPYKNGNEYTADIRFGGRFVLNRLLDYLYKNATIYMQRKYNKAKRFYTYQDILLNQKLTA